MSQALTPQQQQNNKLAAFSNTANELFKKNMPSMKSIISNVVTPERMTRIALHEVRKNPELAECEPVSFIASVMQCAALGLEPGSALGHAYLIPFFNGKKQYKECSLIVGYRGMVDIARRSGKVTKISVRAVYEGDEFEIEYGLNESLVHKPTSTNPSAETLTHVYAVAHLASGEKQFEVLTKAQIDGVKNGLKRPNPVWNSHYEEMAKKTAIRRLFKMLPSALLADDERRLSDIEESDSIVEVTPLDTPEQIAPPGSGPAIREETKAENKSALDKVLNDNIATALSLGLDPDAFLPEECKGKSPDTYTDIQKNAINARLKAAIAAKQKG